MNDRERLMALDDKLAKLEEILVELTDRINEVRAEVENHKKEDKNV
jgi:CII-binding regulator of phage lambda lysogenization HflD|tara:strand:+ start:89 stop:226 length:138 start_codon:yes stop_codon:yes gene_type:complete